MKDQARTQISPYSPLGLVELTRKRTRESLEQIVCEPCPSCNGRGFTKTTETVCYEIFREILRRHDQFDADELVVLANADVVEMLLDEESSRVAQIEASTGKTIRLQTEAMYVQDRFDVVLM